MEKAVISFNTSDGESVSTFDTQGLGYSSFEKFLEVEVPDDQLWVLRKGVDWLLRLLDSSGDDLPDNSRVIVGKESQNIVDRKMIKGGEGVYTVWSGLTFNDQQKDEYENDTVLDMNQQQVQFKAREKVSLYVASTTALDVSKSACDTHLKAEIIETR